MEQPVPVVLWEVYLYIKLYSELTATYSCSINNYNYTVSLYPIKYIWPSYSIAFPKIEKFDISAIGIKGHDANINLSIYSSLFYLCLFTQQPKFALKKTTCSTLAYKKIRWRCSISLFKLLNFDTTQTELQSLFRGLFKALGIPLHVTLLVSTCVGSVWLVLAVSVCYDGW